MDHSEEKTTAKEFSSYSVGVSAEAFAAAQFARFGYDISVQYGANQPEYDLIVHSGDKFLKISVKGSKDGGWGLTQKYKNKTTSYHAAIDRWLEAHGDKTIFCLVQFGNTDDDSLPRIYAATPGEIAGRLKESANGRGETILYENHSWSSRAAAAGTVDRIPEQWKMTRERIKELFSALYG